MSKINNETDVNQFDNIRLEIKRIAKVVAEMIEIELSGISMAATNGVS